jgi:hypothetical protein
MLEQAQWQLRERSSFNRNSPAVPEDPIEAFVLELRPLISSALKRLNNLPSLSGHRLLGVLDHVAAGQTALDRASWLRGELIEAIERLRPPHEPPPKVGGRTGAGGWLHYLVLREAYVDGRPNKEIMLRYSISDGSFARARNLAIDALAHDFAERWHPQAKGLPLASNASRPGSLRLSANPRGAGPAEPTTGGGKTSQ